MLSFLVATKQLKEHFCLSVRPSDRYTFFTMFLSSYHREIFWSYYQWQKWCPCKGQRQRSKVNITEVTTQFSRFRTVTTVWIQLWWRNDAQAWCFLGEVPYCFSRSSVIFQGAIIFLFKIHRNCIAPGLATFIVARFIFKLSMYDLNMIVLYLC